MAADGKNVLIMAGGTGGMSSRPWPAPVNSRPVATACIGWVPRAVSRTNSCPRQVCPCT